MEVPSLYEVEIIQDSIYYKYGFTKPNKDLLQDLHNSGIIIFDYSDHINFFLNEAEEDIENGVRAECIQSAGSEDERHEQSQQDVDDDDADAIGNGIADALPLVLGTF